MAAPRVLVGIDLGQTACKATALEPERGIVAAAAQGYVTAQPHVGWAEQDPADWLAAATACCRELGLAPGTKVVGVAVTGATHNFVLIDAAGAPVRPAITLRDGRATEQAERLNEKLGPELLRRARNVASAGWTAPQLAWISEHEPRVWRRARGLLFAKDYLRAGITGMAATDYIEAEGSLLLNADDHQWDPLLCAAVPIDPAWLPPVLAPAQPAGRLGAEFARAAGLPPGAPVYAGCSDTAAEALASGTVAPGQGIVKLATAGNVNIVSDRPRPSPGYFTYSHPAGGVYHSYGTNAAAASRAWLQGLLGATAAEDYRTLDQEAERVPAAAGGLLFHPYLYGERAPVFDSSLRASFIGLTGRHGRAHLVRAVLEGVALSLAECARAASESGLEIAELRIIGGGARSRLWCQILADALAQPMLVPAMSDASAGAALLAGVGAGAFTDPAAAARRHAGVRRKIVPDPRATTLYAELLELYREARDQLTPLSRRLAELGREA
ncbi:MAG: FGGY family carbohydrate kinase [Solirubrobacteraceae bacterium]